MGQLQLDIMVCIISIWIDTISAHRSDNTVVGGKGMKLEFVSHSSIISITFPVSVCHINARC